MNVRTADRNPLIWVFLLAYAGSCLLFWWLQGILLWLLKLPPLVQPKFLAISIASLGLFCAGYLISVPTLPGLRIRKLTLDNCEQLSYAGTILWTVPALAAAVSFAAYRFTVHYNEGHGPSLLQQTTLYIHLFLGLLYIGLWSTGRSSKSKLGIAIILTIAPRLLVSLRWGRFFVAQAIVPIVFMAIARGWLRLNLKRSIQLSLIALFIILIPAITRGDRIFGKGTGPQPQFVAYLGLMNTMKYFQDNTNLGYPCPPLLVSLTAKVIPYGRLRICTVDVGIDKGLAATLDRLLTKKYTDDMMKGTGANYLLELYLAGGIAAIVFGSVIFGFTCKVLVQLIGYRSLFAGIWAECLSRALFAPRGTLGYVFEKIPALVVAALTMAIAAQLMAKLPLRSAFNLRQAD